MIDYPSKTVYAAPGRFYGVASINDGQLKRGTINGKCKQFKDKREQGEQQQ